MSDREQKEESTHENEGQLGVEGADRHVHRQQ
jgi:hypothetical protein